jgi:hypothetical protein
MDHGIERSLNGIHKERRMNDNRDTRNTFRLADLEARLKTLLPNREDLVQAYICCENVGKPIPSMDIAG